MKNFSILFAIFISFSFFSFSQNVYITESLREQIQFKGDNETIPVLVVLEQQLNFYSMKESFNQQNLTANERAKIVIDELLKQKNIQQANFVKSLVTYQKQNPNQLTIKHRYWIVNMILVDATPDAIEYLSKKSDIRYLEYADNKIALIEPVQESDIETKAPTNNTEIGLIDINAPAMWALGYTGRGRIVYNYDTGICPDHPAIDEDYLGLYLPQSQCWYPYFSEVPAEGASNHGTHTLGTMIGLDDATHDTIGIAFNAYWIGNDLVTSTVEELPPISDMVLAFEWALNPDGDSTTVDDIPDVINNSWRWYDGDDTNYCNGFVVDMLSALEDAGIATIFSGGNSGPNNISVNSPQRTKINPVNSFCVGAIDGGDPTFPITSFSTRGPSQCTDDSLLQIHPEVVAPGYYVRSCVGETGYSTKSGTSMSCPHVSGAVLLLKEAFPNLTGELLLTALYNTATDLGEPGEDNTYGRGIIDVYAAYQLLCQTYTPTPPSYDYDIAIADVEFQNCVDNITPLVKVSNLGNLDITNFNLIFNVDSNLVENYYYSGTLSSGDTVEINLSSYSLSNYGEYEIELQLLIDSSLVEVDNFNDSRILKHTYQNTDMPFSEGFELAEIPVCWDIVYEEGHSDWVFNSNAFQAHTGDFYALITKQEAGDQTTKLMTHKLDITSYTNPVLHFWNIQQKNFSFQDMLKIYYKDSYSANWQLIDSFDTEIPDWTEQTIALPNPSNDYYIAFEGNMFGGKGIVIDDVSIVENTYIQKLNTNFRIYPNPTSGKLYIQSNSVINSKVEISIFNSVGKIVYKNTGTFDKIKNIDISELEPGLYHLKIIGDNIIYNKKIIIQK